MLKIRTGNDWVSEQTRKLITGGYYGDSGGKWQEGIDGCCWKFALEAFENENTGCGAFLRLVA